MTENTMPAAEAIEATPELDLASYELAFHVLPTVAEGEVEGVTDSLKSMITKAGGAIFDEEAPEHFELAYEVEKYLEGKYRRFNTAYFGWVRFTIAPITIADLMEEVEGHKSILRHLCIRLTKAEEAHPFRFHEALDTKQVRTVSDDTEAVAPVAEADPSEAAETEETVSETPDTMTDESPKAS